MRPELSLDHRGLDALVRQHGSPFHLPSFLSALEAAWPGIESAEHVSLCEGDAMVALLPAYLYGSCPRLEYYKRIVTPPLAHVRVLMAHTLVGWFGGCVGETHHATAAVARLMERASELGVPLVISGIDGRDLASRARLAELGIECRRYHTLVVRSLCEGDALDPAASLPSRHRHKVRQSHAGARRAGVTAGEPRPEEVPAIVQLLGLVLRQHGTPEAALRPAFVHEVLSRCRDVLDVRVARDESGRIIGTILNLVLGERYYLWCAGHDRRTLSQYKQAHLLYRDSLQRAASMCCREAVGGRGMSQMKQQHGFRPVPLMLGVWGPGRIGEETRRWAAAIEDRHRIAIGGGDAQLEVELRAQGG